MIILLILVILVVIAGMSGRVYLKSRDIRRTRRIAESRSRQAAAWQKVLDQNALGREVKP